MNNFAQQLHDELMTELDALTYQNEERHGDTREQLRLVWSAIDQLKTRLKTYQFETDDEEIDFFKNMLPKFLSQFIYYSEMSAIESCERFGSDKSLTDYIENLAFKFDCFFKNNEEFFNYCRFRKTLLDQHYFVRSEALKADQSDMPGHHRHGR